MSSSILLNMGGDMGVWGILKAHCVSIFYFL